MRRNPHLYYDKEFYSKPRCFSECLQRPPSSFKWKRELAGAECSIEPYCLSFGKTSKIMLSYSPYPLRPAKDLSAEKAVGSCFIAILISYDPSSACMCTYDRWQPAPRQDVRQESTQDLSGHHGLRRPALNTINGTLEALLLRFLIDNTTRVLLALVMYKRIHLICNK